MEFKVLKVYYLFKTHLQVNKFNKIFNKIEEILRIKQESFNIIKCGI